MENKRLHPRFRCEGGVEIQVPGTNRRLWGHLSDLSHSGIYMETAEPWETGIEIEIHIDCCGKTVHAKGKAVTSHPGVGLGITIDEIDPQHQKAFDELLSELAKPAEASSSPDTEGHTSTV